MMFIKLKEHQFSPMVWVILAGILLLRIGTTISVPFLSIFLHFKVGISLPMTGFIVGISYLSYVGGGIFGGILSDNYGRRKIFGISLFFYALTFFGFGLAALLMRFPVVIVTLFCSLNLIGGLFRIWSETLGQAMLSDLVTEEQKVAAFSFRYTAMNIGSAIGPVLGSILGFSGTMAGFYITGLMCLAYFFLFISVSRKVPNECKKIVERIKFLETFRVLVKDKALMYFIFGGMFAYLVYVQQESTLGQILMQRFGNAHLFAILLTMNAVVVIFLQIPLTNYCMRSKSLLSVMKLGCVFLCIGLFGLAFAERGYVLYIISQIILTIGEMLIFPLGGIFIDKIAPVELRGSYFGATGFQYFGRAIGPFLGGLALQELNGKIALSIFAVVALATIFFYHKGSKASEQKLTFANSLGGHGATSIIEQADEA
jgi:MFS family permease